MLSIALLRQNRVTHGNMYPSPYSRRQGRALPCGEERCLYSPALCIFVVVNQLAGVAVLRAERRWIGEAIELVEHQGWQGGGWGPSAPGVAAGYSWVLSSYWLRGLQEGSAFGVLSLATASSRAVKARLDSHGGQAAARGWLEGRPRRAVNTFVCV